MWRGILRKTRWLLPLAAMVAAGVYLEAASRFEAAALISRPGPLVLDRQGEILRLGPDALGRKAVSLPPGPLPPQVAAAFIAAEDQRFRRHPGVDLLAVLRAAGQDLAAMRIVSGASTITQQLARLAYPGPRTFWRKAVEMVRSLRIETALTKEEILRAYLDQVPLGYNLVGVEAAALAYFGKPAADLTLPQAALLAALAKAPGTLRPHGRGHARLLTRQQWVLSRMARLGLINPQELAAAREAPLALGQPGRRFAAMPFEAPHFVQLVLSQGGNQGSPPWVLKTTLDLPRQRCLEALLRSHRARLQKCGAAQAAMVLVDNRTLEVLALAGSYQYGARDRGFNNGAAALRSPGSTLKPFLYAQALDLGFTPAIVLEDVERRYRTPRGEFHPANFDRAAQGPVSFREALGNSLNLSAVALLNRVGPPAFYETLRTLRLINHPERSPEHYGLGLVVGNPEVSLLQLAAAYASLANQGVFKPLRFKGDDPYDPGIQVFSPQAAYIVSDILSDPLARGRIFGGSLAMNQPYQVAVKTGTSTRYRDCWAVAYSPEYTLAVWAGNFGGGPTANLSGASAAAPILADLARELFGESTPAAFSRPPGVAALNVCAFSGHLPGPGCAYLRRELFISGTEPDWDCSLHQPRDPYIRLATPFAGWLHQRFTGGGAGRYRLEGFSEDLNRVFPGTGPEAAAPAFLPGPPPPGGASPPTPLSGPDQALPVTITYPLAGDCFLLQAREEVIRLTAKASCRGPVSRVTWFVDGLEVGAGGPPYEVSLELGRGRHQLMAVGPEGAGDLVAVEVQ